uniref:Sigma non-opioid intracellular receptor 1 n=1 Tax=Trichuris muris TaxID=70415 RepID=A0A5S6QEW0_TRIMR
MFRRFMTLVRAIIIAYLGVSMIRYALVHNSYLFSPRHIRSLGEKYAGQPLADSVMGIHQDLNLEYRKHLIKPWSKGLLDHFEKQTYSRSRGLATGFWLPFNGGGLVGRIHFIHISMFEYLAIIGSPVKTAGTSGWLWMNQTCAVLSGSVERSDGFQRETFEPGKHVRLGQFQSSIVELNEDTWLFCYGRGFTPTAIPYMMLHMVGNADFLSIIQLTSISMQAVGSEWYNSAKMLSGQVMDKFKWK